DRIAHVDTIIGAEKLKRPPGRPAASPELAEVQAVARASADPPELVVARYKREAEAKPNDAEAQFLLGRVYQTVGQFEAAKTALERGRAGGGVGGGVDRPRGSVYRALKTPAGARAALGRRLAQHPDDAFARLELGKALGDSGDASGSLVELQRAITLDPDLDEAQRLTGLALGRKGEEAEGVYHLAVASRLRGELEQALSHFQRTEHPRRPGSGRGGGVGRATGGPQPLVREREGERQERRRTGRRGVALGPPRPLR